MCVRPSTTFYGSFSLDMGRSPGFGSTPTDYSALLGLGLPSAPYLKVLNLASQRNSPDRSTKSTPFTVQCKHYRCSTVCKHRVSGSLSLPSRGPFHLSFTVLSAIGHWVVFSLTGWSPLVQSRFLVSRPTLDTARAYFNFVYGAFTLSGWLSQNHSTIVISHFLRSEPRHARTPVWALARSLAATCAITVVFSSSGYLDVSVRRVPLIQLCVHCMMTVVCTAGFPHSEISGSLVVCTSPKLFAAYHVFHRLPVPRHPPCALSCITNSLKVRDVLQGNTYSVTCSGCLV